MTSADPFYLIGYSGHAFVVLESALESGLQPLGYFEMEEKALNPYQLPFMGSEDRAPAGHGLFIGIGSNAARAAIFGKLPGSVFINIIDPSAQISRTAQLQTGIYAGKNVCVNALSTIGKGVILNTGAIVEHECSVGDFSHIAPGAVLCGNVKVGKGSFVGAGSVVRQGITIGDNVLIGAGSVVVKNIENNTRHAGNPARQRNL